MSMALVVTNLVPHCARIQCCKGQNEADTWIDYAVEGQEYRLEWPSRCFISPWMGGRIRRMVPFMEKQSGRAMLCFSVQRNDDEYLWYKAERRGFKRDVALGNLIQRIPSVYSDSYTTVYALRDIARGLQRPACVICGKALSRQKTTWHLSPRAQEFVGLIRQMDQLIGRSGPVCSDWCSYRLGLRKRAFKRKREEEKKWNREAKNRLKEVRSYLRSLPAVSPSQRRASRPAMTSPT